MTEPGPSGGAAAPPAFLDLAERLRQRGQLDAALSVALAGVARFPAMADAHDLLGRVRADQGDDDGARSAWLAALECEAGRIGPLKGLAFLAFRRGDLAEAERRLEAAATGAPRDAAILAALDRVRAARPAPTDERVGFEDPAAGLLLLDSQGLRVAGGVGPGDNGRLADAAAATATGVARETRRTCAILDLGAWRHLLVDGERNRLALLPVAPHGSLLVRRSIAAPAGRMLAVATKAATAARRWLRADT